MTSWSIFRACLLGFTCVVGVLGAAIAGNSSSVKPPASKEWATAEQTILSPHASTQDHTAQPRTHLATVPSPLTRQEAHSGFERYIAGLGRLSAALMDPEYDWKTAGAHATPTTPDEGSHGSTDFRHDVQKLFALAGTMKRLNNALKQLRSSDDDRDMQDVPTPSSEAETNLPSRLHAALTAAFAELSRLFYYYFSQESGRDEDINDEEGKTVEVEDGIQVLMETLEALARAHTNYTAVVNSTSTPAGRIVESFTPEIPESSTQALLDWHENQRGLLQVATQLKALLGLQPLEGDRNDTVLAAQPSTIPSTSTTTITTTTTSPEEPREQPCLPPFQLIAYRMCILQEMQLKLPWGDAQEFCRKRGAKLAEDMVVIKTRRFLNDLYGEDGTRTRWPVWVGGRRAGQTWIWEGSQQVPEFLWAPSEPRDFNSHLAPEGQCMMLDGYRRFYGASLPCHLRRRFVCQLGN